jgi:hypothetical protein
LAVTTAGDGLGDGSCTAAGLGLGLLAAGAVATGSVATGSDPTTPPGAAPTSADEVPAVVGSLAALGLLTAVGEGAALGATGPTKPVDRRAAA